MHVLRLASLAIWQRKARSLTLLLVSAVAVMVAAVGPMYSRAAEESLLRDRLQRAPAETTGVEFGLATSGGLDVGAAVASSTAAGADTRLDRWFSKPVLALQVVRPIEVVPSASQRPVAVARLAWRDGMCRELVITGRCPSGMEDAVVSRQSAQSLGLALGDVISLPGLTVDEPPPFSPRVVGIYVARDETSSYWFGQDFFDAGPQPRDLPPRIDTIFVDRPAVEMVQATAVRADVSRLMRIDQFRVADVPKLERLAASLRGARTAQQVAPEAGMPFLGLFDEVGADRRVVRTAAAAITIQLLLLTWFVLFLVVSSATEDRAGEMALAKLRGHGPLAATVFGLLEPLIVLFLSFPLGLILGTGLTRLLANAVLLPGTPVRITGWVFVSASIALCGGVVAATVAARRVLSRPVLEQIRRTTGARPSIRRAVAIDAVVVALAVVGIWQVNSGEARQGGAIALLTPGLIALAIGLVGVRAVPLLARWSAGRTGRSPRTSAFLASRQVLRRTSSLRVVVLLTVAVALATFALNAFVVADRNRANRANQEVGASDVLLVRVPSAPALLDAVRAVDPSGRLAMAVAERAPTVTSIGNTTGDTNANTTGRMLAVDTSRLSAVAAWDDSWLGLSPSRVADLLRPPAGPAVTLPGTQLRLRVDTSALAATDAVSLVALVDEQAGRRAVDLGRLRPGTGVYQAALRGCSTGCRLAGITVERPPATFDTRILSIVVSEISVDGRRVDAGLRDVARWRVVQQHLYDPTFQEPVSLTATQAGLRAEITLSEELPPLVAPADVPDALPAFLGAGDPIVPYQGKRGIASGATLDGTQQLIKPVGLANVLPRLGRDGMLVDLDYAIRLGTGEQPPDRAEVWVAPGHRAAIDRGLQERGVQVIGSESAHSRRAALDREGLALAMLLFITAALAALVLAVVAVGTMLLVVARNRSGELAALRVLGIGTSTLVRACTFEQLALLGAGVLLGAIAGMVAGFVIFPLLPFDGGLGSGPPVLLAPAWLAVLVLLVFVVAVVITVAVVSARFLVRRSSPELVLEGAP